MKGSYILLIELEKDKTITIGKKGKIIFKKGYYVYVGSALNNLEKRINRHIKTKKKMHWHIDYLLKHANIINAFYKENSIKEECGIAKIFNDEFEYINGFGCSDCKCKSHLFFSNKNLFLNYISNLKMEKYTFFK